MKRTKRIVDTAAKRAIRGLGLREAVDAYGVPYGVLTSGARCTILATASSDESVLALIERAAGWSRWLETLGVDDRVCGASCSIESWTDGAHRMTVGLSLSALPIPGLERKRLGERAMLTWISSHLAGLLDGLRRASGPLDVSVCDEQMVIDLSRVAFDATIASDVRAARANQGTGLTWEDVPPRPERVTADLYSHDRASSLSWTISARDDEEVSPLALEEVLRPNQALLGVRATTIFRPRPTIEGRLGALGTVLTADVDAGADVSLARSVPLSQTLRTRLRLRSATHTQDTTFLMGLPLDLAGPHTTARPDNLKKDAR